MTINQERRAEAVGYVHFEYEGQSLARLDKLRGWAFFQDQRYELQDMDELPKDHVWLSNLDWIKHQALVGPNRMHIKSDMFLPLTLDQIKHELALSDIDHEQFSRVLVSIGDNLLRLCVEAYGEGFLVHLYREKTFSKAIAATIGINQINQPHPDDELHSNIIWNNLQDKTFLADPDPSLPVVCFRMLMYRHAANLMQCPLPYENEAWREVKVAPSSLDAFFAREDMPSIVEVTALKIPSHLEGIYPSLNTSKFERGKRWMPNIEAAFLRKIGHLEVGRVFVQPSGYQPTSPWSNCVPTVNGTLQLSYSAQMLCHAHFLSAAVSITDKYWPMHAWWIRSMDRLVMAMAVMPLVAIDGIKLISYGEGCAFLQGSPIAIGQAISLAPRVGLSPTQSAWKACDYELGKEILANPLWLPDDFTAYEKTSMQLTHREIGLTLRLDEAALLSLSSEELAQQALTQLMRGMAHGRTY